MLRDFAGYSCCIVLATLLMACKSGPVPLVYGKDSCDYCKMKLVDEKTGAELITVKGRVYKFDDIGCMLNYELEKLGSEGVEKELVVNYLHKGELMEAGTAVFLKGQAGKSPMRSDLAAFQNENEVALYLTHPSGEEKLSWTTVKKGFNK